VSFVLLYLALRVIPPITAMNFDNKNQNLKSRGAGTDCVTAFWVLSFPT